MLDGIEQKRINVITDAISYLKSRGYRVPTVENVFSTKVKSETDKRSSWDTDRRINACNRELKTVAEWSKIWGINYNAGFRFILKYDLPYKKESL